MPRRDDSHFQSSRQHDRDAGARGTVQRVVSNPVWDLEQNKKPPRGFRFSICARSLNIVLKLRDGWRNPLYIAPRPVKISAWTAILLV